MENEGEKKQNRNFARTSLKTLVKHKSQLVSDAHCNIIPSIPSQAAHL